MTNAMKKIASIALGAVLIAGVIASFNTITANAATKPAKVKITSVVIDNSTLNGEIKWKKAKRAKKYQVYYKKSTDKKWKTKTTKKLKLKIADYFEYETKYQFKVRGLNGKKKGSFSKLKSLTVPTKPVDDSGDENDEDEFYNLEEISPDLPEDTRIYHVEDTVKFGENLDDYYGPVGHEVTIHFVYISSVGSYCYRGTTVEGLPFYYSHNSNNSATYIIGDSGNVTYNDKIIEGNGWTAAKRYSGDGYLNYGLGAWEELAQHHT